MKTFMQHAITVIALIVGIPFFALGFLVLVGIDLLGGVDWQRIAIQKFRPYRPTLGETHEQSRT